ncbi:hypothetical protein [Micromonospora sp. NPDC048830]|uniref:hypothetical protein n=1 Tax=Micromonospora sp. NPDC048830 TaxID=3364257 RepID=UPI00371A738A
MRPSERDVLRGGEAVLQSIRSTRPGGHVGYVGVTHGVELPGQELFYSHVDPGKVFDLTLPLDQAAEGYRAMDERRAIKTLLRP